MEFRVDFDEASGKVTVVGDIKALLQKPLLRTFTRKNGAEQQSDTLLTFVVPPARLSATFQELKKVLARYGLSAQPTDHASSTLQRVIDEEHSFDQFSRHAESIWRADIDLDEFREFVAVVSAACPGRTFYRRQLLAAFHLAFSQNACNFSVPGSGKTSIVYAAFAYLNRVSGDATKAVNHLLIVGPLSSFKAWEDEFRDIFGRRPNVVRLSGAMPAADRRDYLRGIDMRSRSTELTLTSYQALNISEADFRSFLSNPSRRVMMVLDEAHYVKRDDGEWASTALALAPLAKSRVVLTGTPAPNGYEDLANLFKFIYPDKAIVGFPIGTLRAMNEGHMASAVDVLKARVRPFYTRIKKSDLNLPPIEEFRIEIAMDSQQERIYRGIERLIVPNLRNETSAISGPLLRARLIRLRQAATNPALLLRPIEEELSVDGSGRAALQASELEISNLVRGFDPGASLVRLEQTKELVRSIIGAQGKVLVWSVFLGNLALLKDSLGSYAQYVETITGATPINGGEDDTGSSLETRERIIDRFHRVGETAILIANPQAVGESISLHKVCHSAIYFDRDFNAGRFIQSKDRIHRYGLDPVRDITRYYYLNAENTVDDDIDLRLSLKERRMADLIDSEEIPLFAAAADQDESYEDIRAVIESYERRKKI